MIIQAEKNTFELVLPKGFIPKSIKKRYEKYLNRMPNAPITDIQDFVSHTMQRVNFPGFSYSPAIQNQRGAEVAYRSGVPYQNLFNKDLEITFLATDGLLNYFILLETAIYWYERSTKELFIPDFRLYTTDTYGVRLCTLLMKQITFIGLDPLEWDYSDTSPDTQQFTAKFQFNKAYLELIGEDTNK